MAEVKITELPELTTIADADVLAVVDDVAGTPTTKKITRANLMTGHTHVRATNHTLQAIPTGGGAATTMTFDLEVYDTLGEFIPGTGIFTATQAGYYLISGGCSSVQAVFPVGETWWARPYKGATIIATGDIDLSENAAANLNRYSYFTTAINLIVGDTICIKVTQTQGGAVNIRNDAGYEFNYITIDRLI